MKNLPHSRRNFIIKTGTLGASIFLSPYLSWSKSKKEEIEAILVKNLGIDTHNHIDVPLNKADFPGPKLDLLGEMKKSGLSAICMTFALDYQKLSREGEAFERFENGLNALDEVLNQNGMERALVFGDLERSIKNNQPTLIQSIEGGHFLEGKLERLEWAYKRGLRHFGLLHDSNASTPLGDIYTNPPQWNGLTDFGKQVVEECNRLGILIDLTHCSNEAINAALKISKTPMMVSHTGLNTQLGNNPQMAKIMAPRLISREQAKILADSGGVIGVWTHLSDSALEYAQNIKAMVNVVGIDQVCIGTDTKMTPSYHPEGDAPRPPRNGERTNGAWAGQSQGFYYEVVDALLKTGFKEEEIAKIGSLNFLRVLKLALNKR